MIKEIIAHITCACGTGAGKTDDLEILFRMDSGYRCNGKSSGGNLVIYKG